MLEALERAGGPPISEKREMLEALEQAGGPPNSAEQAISEAGHPTGSKNVTSGMDTTSYQVVILEPTNTERGGGIW